MDTMVSIEVASSIISQSVFHALKDTIGLKDHDVEKMSLSFRDTLSKQLTNAKSQDSFIDIFLKSLEKELIKELDLTDNQKQKLNASLKSYAYTFRHMSQSDS